MRLTDRIRNTAKSMKSRALSMGVAALTLLSTYSLADWIASVTLRARDAVEQHQEVNYFGATNGATRSYDAGIDVADSTPSTNKLNIYQEPDSGLESKLDENYIGNSDSNQSFRGSIKYSQDFSPTSAVVTVDNLPAGPTGKWALRTFKDTNSWEAAGLHAITNGQEIAVGTNAQSYVIAPLIRVGASGDYTNIQQAIDAASDGSIISIDAGRYNENLVISNKSLRIIGAGVDTIVHNTNSPLINIVGPADVEIANMRINGGWYVSGSNFFSTVSKGIVATNSDVTLNNLVLNQFGNRFVDLTGGSLSANNVQLEAQTYYMNPCDIGFILKGCSAELDKIRYDKGKIDHIISINDGPYPERANVIVENSDIRLDNSTYGDGVRVVCNADVEIKDSYFYRDSTNSIPEGTLIHNGVGITGYSNNVTIANNIFDKAPWAVYCTGSLIDNSNKIKVENNEIKNCVLGGIAVCQMDYKGVDLGGGNLGSAGGNAISHTNAPTNYVADVWMSDVGQTSTANIWALNNSFSSTNKEERIYDKLDNPACGRLITDHLRFKGAGKDTNSNHVMRWNERGANEKYTVQSCSNLVGEIWTNLPGMPVTNSSLTADMSYTNTYNSGSNSAVFYRIGTEVP